MSIPGTFICRRAIWGIVVPLHGMHALEWTPAQRMKLGTHGTYSRTFEWLDTYFLTLLIALVSPKGKVKLAWNKVPTANRLVVIGGCSVHPLAYYTIHSIRSLLQALKKLSEISSWNTFRNNVQSAILWHLISGPSVKKNQQLVVHIR